MRTTRQRVIALLWASVLVTGLGLGHPAGAGPTTDPQTAADYGAGYLARLVDADGVVGDPTDPNYSLMGDAALAFIASGVGGDAFDAIVEHLREHVDDFTGTGTDTSPGRVGILIMIAVAAGDDPTAFGTPAVDLVERLKATQRDDGSADAGLFGASDPSFDGAYRQGLALDGLAAAGLTTADLDVAAAVAWLHEQQCDDGAWTPYQPDTSAACPTTFSSDFTDPQPEDTNSTALATEGLAAVGALAAAPQGDPLDWLEAAQNDDGGFGFLTDAPTDANSTGVVLRAIVAGGEDPGAGRWADDTPTPMAALFDLQIGCDGAEADRGAFDYQDPDEAPFDVTDLRAGATAQAVPGVAGVAFPPTDAVTLSSAEPVVSCQATVETTTTTAAPTTSTTRAAVAAAGGTLPTTGSNNTRGLSAAGMALVGAGGLLVSLLGLTRFSVRPGRR